MQLFSLWKCWNLAFCLTVDTWTCPVLITLAVPPWNCCLGDFFWREEEASCFVCFECFHFNASSPACCLNLPVGSNLKLNDFLQPSRGSPRLSVLLQSDTQLLSCHFSSLMILPISFWILYWNSFYSSFVFFFFFSVVESWTYFNLVRVVHVFRCSLREFWRQVHLLKPFTWIFSCCFTSFHWRTLRVILA